MAAKKKKKLPAKVKTIEKRIEDLEKEFDIDNDEPLVWDLPSRDKDPIITRVPFSTTVAYPYAFLRAVELVLDQEGGFVNDPLDPGGATNMGITISTLSRYRTRKAGYPITCTVTDVMNLTRDEAIAIYHLFYWKDVRLDNLIPYENLAVAVFNQGVLRGPITVIKNLQKVVGATQDGVLGSVTAGRIKTYGANLTLREFLQVSEHAYIDVVINRSTSIKYLHGWLNRVHQLWDLLIPMAAA
jgi:lysozyme family protein